MTYDPFSNFSNNPYLRQIQPSSASFGRPNINPFARGIRGMNPTQRASYQQQEFGRLSNLQNLQQGAFTLSEQQRKAEEEKMMEAARRRVFGGGTQVSGDDFARTGRTQSYIDPFYLERAKREKELEDLQLGKLRMESGVGGPMFSAFSGGGSGMGSQSTFGRSWSVPSFPSQGGMG